MSELAKTLSFELSLRVCAAELKQRRHRRMQICCQPDTHAHYGSGQFESAQQSHLAVVAAKQSSTPIAEQTVYRV